VARRGDGAGGRIRIDRLARSIGDLQDIVRAVRARGASLKATEQPIDTSTATGKCFLDMLGVFAELDEPAPRTPAQGDRQGQGRRRVQGPTNFDRRRPGARNEGPGAASEIAKALKIDRASVYRGGLYRSRATF
jgi:DNA invertase Pin-like site-specific DNA recombinase